MTDEPGLLHLQGPVLSTMEQDGSRRWMYPRLAGGRFLTRRRLVAYFLIALYTTLPFIPINGKPAVFLDLAHRRFTLFGFTFLPTDTILLALFLLSTILTIFLLTALLGRVWCGWACPQTVYMEFVFRPIERLFTGRSGVGGKPRGTVAGWRRVLMFATFLLLSLHLSNTFLAYFVGAAQLHRWILSSPLQHPGGFTIVMVVTGLMMFNFGWFREQTCLIACPYGRFQSVLLDRYSLIISYEAARGEPRGRLTKSKQPALSLPVVADAEGPQRGDCVDCDMCVAVCPTGIDIRNGLQFECVGCAQCVDACDSVMTKIGRPLGLIRYDSQANMSGEKRRIVRPRVIIYPLLLTIVLSILIYMLATKSPLDVTVLRSTQPFFLLPSGQVQDLMYLKLANRTDHPERCVVSIPDETNVKVASPPGVVEIPADTTQSVGLLVIADRSVFKNGPYQVKLHVDVERAGGTYTIVRRCPLEGPSPMPNSSQPATSEARP